MGDFERSARVDYTINKQKAYQSQAKALLYRQDNGRPVTPMHTGRKSVPHAGEHSGAPFATFEEKPGTPHSRHDGLTVDVSHSHGGPSKAHAPPPPPPPKTYQPLSPKRGGASKVGAGGSYDPEVYRQALEANATNMQAQKTRNWGSAGLLGTHPTDPE